MFFCKKALKVSTHVSPIRKLIQSSVRSHFSLSLYYMNNEKVNSLDFA